VRVGTKKRALRSNKETDEGQRFAALVNSLTKNAPYKACTVSTAIYASAAEFEAGQPLPPIIAARLANAVDQFAGHLKARCADAA